MNRITTLNRLTVVISGLGKIFASMASKFLPNVKYFYFKRKISLWNEIILELWVKYYFRTNKTLVM